MTQNYGTQRKQEPDIINVKRNPYLVDYEEQRRLREKRAAGQTQQVGRAGTAQTQQVRRAGTAQTQVRRTGTAQMQQVHRAGTAQTQVRRPQTVHTQTRQYRRMEETRKTVQRPEEARQLRMIPDADRRQSRQAAIQRRRKRVYRQRLVVVCIFALCIVAVFCLSMLKQGNAAVAGSSNSGSANDVPVAEQLMNQTADIQGLPAAEFAKHPAWTEDFLTPNEYSRPGEVLPEVTNIFVHYTANPGTSAAQNRSYFEQQKDMHEASVSAHFIIGYEGEIIQCVPLDEIAYAVQTRNYDSVSIECCYKAQDGSFTQETYDSLISLLAWLTDIYNLETDDILRHYDCGGKKCPLYYTEHPDAWKQLKEDVAEAREEQL